MTEAIVTKLRTRQRVGQIKYGITLHDNPKHDGDPVGWLRELQEELLDAVQYIEKFLLDNERSTP